MDSRQAKLGGICKWSKKKYATVVGRGGEEGEEGEEKRRLLPAAKGGGGVAPKRRRVRWNDHNGRELVEVLEFHTSDSSDSDDEFVDSCICTIM